MPRPRSNPWGGVVYCKRDTPVALRELSHELTSDERAVIHQTSTCLCFEAQTSCPPKIVVFNSQQARSDALSIEFTPSNTLAWQGQRIAGARGGAGGRWMAAVTLHADTCIHTHIHIHIHIYILIYIWMYIYMHMFFSSASRGSAEAAPCQFRSKFWPKSSRNFGKIKLLYRAILPETVYLLISFRKSTPQQNCRLDILTSNSKQKNPDFWGEWNI